MPPEGTEGGFDAGVGQGDTPEGTNQPPIDPPMPPEPPMLQTAQPIEKKQTANIGSIAERLSAKEGGEAVERTESGMQAESPMPFDLSKMTLEQMQQLKAMLASTPDGSVQKTFKPTVKLRRMMIDLGEGRTEEKIVIDFGRAYLTEMRDLELNRNVERHVIPVTFLGEREATIVAYKKFIESEQIVCEVLSQRSIDNPVKEGVTKSRETGTLVEMVRKEIKQFFTVKLPAGSAVESVEIEARVANG